MEVQGEAVTDEESELNADPATFRDVSRISGEEFYGVFARGEHARPSSPPPHPDHRRDT